MLTRLFQGKAARPVIESINIRLEALKAEAASNFPLTAAEVAMMRENLRTHILKIRDLEQEAVKMLSEAMI